LEQETTVMRIALRRIFALVAVDIWASPRVSEHYVPSCRIRFARQWQRRLVLSQSLEGGARTCCTTCGQSLVAPALILLPAGWSGSI